MRESSPNSRNSVFLIVGSMKSGTTSLFNDMAKHPAIFSPSVKEPDDLADDAVLTDAGRKKYYNLFKGAKPDQWIGEASTAYAKYPDISGVPQRALEILGPETRLIFIGRDPVERLRSHYRHEIQNRNFTKPLREVLTDWPILERVSDYDLQLAQWLEVFSRDQLLVLRMQDYNREPKTTLNRVFRFLNLPALEEVGPVEVGEVANSSAGKRQPHGLMRTIMYSDLMQRNIKPLIPRVLRSALQKLLIPKGVSCFDDELPPEMEQELRARMTKATKNFEQFAAEDLQRYAL
ncbi:sulfotransferase [Martelella sp. HB161492]|uniref:sulfotransferase family protein n=1 Tax=Martelella sp. HB161492 TaxID=2720726 RepID=UPI00159021EE|nr:sulfotransferase [Martelella sp. HB161492]